MFTYHVDAKIKTAQPISISVSNSILQIYKFTMGVSLKFSHDVEYDPKTLPDAQAIAQAAAELVNEIRSSWSKGKTFHEQGQVVHTFNTRKGADFDGAGVVALAHGQHAGRGRDGYHV